jgi:diguanylate cyclase (GGDEF)-like protein
MTGEMTPAEALLELARSAGEDSLPVLLSVVASTIRAVCGYSAVVVNIYRPAWDDYEVVYVLGSDESHEVLDGTCAPSATWNRLFAVEQQRLPGVFFLTAEAAFWDGLENVYTPDIPRSEDPQGWQADDGLLVFLRDPDGAPLGFLSMDEPTSGQRPTDEDLRQVRAICSHAEQALASARRNERAMETERMLSSLVTASTALSTCVAHDETLRVVCNTVVPHLGFERVAAYSMGVEERLRLTAHRGWPPPAPLSSSLDPARLEALLDPARERAGCWLLSAAEVFTDVSWPEGLRSARNGAGAAAWNEYCLVVPIRSDDGSLRSVLVIEDPADRLLPTDEHCRAVRLLADQLAASENGLDHREQLSRLASHDPLTGVRNRRGLTDLLARHPGAALVICDLDHFKAVNDRHGHNVGDLVLARFGELLRELCREDDVAVRLGGEEFCVVLPHTDRAGAIRAAERLRTETSRRMRDLVPDGITVSVGVADDPDGVLEPEKLLSVADRGLYMAKQAGRDRSALAEDPAGSQPAGIRASSSV